MSADIATKPRSGQHVCVIRAARLLVPVAIVVGIALAGLGFLITHPEGLFNRYSDLLAYHLGAQTVLYNWWQATHRLPLWRSDIFSGAPAFANPQSMYTHPLHLFFLIDRPERVVGLVMWLQMVLGALGGYYAASVLRLSVPGRMLVAVSVLFSFKTLLAVYAGWLTLLSGIAAMPWLFATAAVVLERPSLRSALAFSAAGALVLHSGHPQFPFYAWLFVSVWSACRIARLLVSGNTSAAVRVVGALLVGSVLAAGLSAYIILPIAQNVPLVARWNSGYDVFLGNHPVTPLDLLTVFNPEAFGTPLDGSYVQAWESMIYFGAAPSLLALAGAFQGRHRPYVIVLIGGVLLSVALGVHSPITQFAYAVVPGFHYFRLPGRVLFVTAFFISCLAGVGFDIVLSAARTVVSRRIVAGLIIGVVALEGTFWARRYLRVAEAAPYGAAGAYIGSLVSAVPGARVAPLGRSVPSYGAAAPLGLQLITGYDPFNLGHYQTFIDLLQYGREVDREPVGDYRQPNWTDLRRITRFDMLAALNVEYIVSPAAVTLPEKEYGFVRSFGNQSQFQFYEGLRSGPVYVYQNRRPLGRAFFVSDVVTVMSEPDAVAEVLKTDLRATAVVMGSPSNGSSVSAAGDRVDVVQTLPGRLNLITRTSNSRFLVVSEVWLPGWSVRVDDRPAVLQRADVALQGLWVPAGEHRVELSYWPTGLTAGLIVTGLSVSSLVGLAGFLAVHRRRRA